MFHVVLYRPEIPPNTGNVMRLVANAGVTLHLVHPLGFPLDDTKLKRAGMDYREYADVVEHPDFESMLSDLAISRVFALSRDAERDYTSVEYGPTDVLLFGQESTGLPAVILQHERITAALRIPMRAGSRSLNLSNSVAIVLYEALRQAGFPEMGSTHPADGS
ncbi:MAG: tRNA (cytidine(34)-2'-O)-methyltransferase [Acidimicrobiia bacterium]|nr:tRNA (cytidine(34)-2'-O)-methyltransferase [Acidimicrobiia bacterium]NNC42941.1 tRNA (cytidine(34)-2'-O)-methyltransferase [Acidimicrobiia bacterium]